MRREMRLMVLCGCLGVAAFGCQDDGGGAGAGDQGLVDAAVGDSFAPDISGSDIGGSDVGAQDSAPQPIDGGGVPDMGGGPSVDAGRMAEACPVADERQGSSLVICLAFTNWPFVATTVETRGIADR